MTRTPDLASRQVVSLGSHVLLEDLDDGRRDVYVLVSSTESNPGEGRLSNESPVGRAISGHRSGDVVDVHAPHRIRRLRLAAVCPSGPKHPARAVAANGRRGR